MRYLIVCLFLYLLTFTVFGASRTNYVEISHHGSKPSNPSSGSSRLYLDTDGNAKLLKSDGSESPVGGGLGDSDTLYLQDFESKKPIDYFSDKSGNCTVVNNETGAISAKRSFKITVASGDLGCKLTSPSIALDPEGRDVALGFIPKVLYSGNDKDIKIVFYESSDNLTFNELTSYYLDQATRVKPDAFNLKFGANATHWKYEIVVSTENIGAVLELDKIKLVTNPFKYRDALISETSSFKGVFTNLSGGRIGFAGAETTDTSEKLYSVNKSGDGDVITFHTDVDFTINGTFPTNVAGTAVMLAKNATTNPLLNTDSNVLDYGYNQQSTNYVAQIGYSGEFKNGDTLRLYCGSGMSITSEHSTLSFTATKKSTNVIFKGYSLSKWNSYTPDVGLTGGVSVVSAQWKKSGKKMKIEANIKWSSIFTGGIPTISIPNGYKIDTSAIMGIPTESITDFGKARFRSNGVGGTYHGVVTYKTETEVSIDYSATINGNIYLYNNNPISTSQPFTWIANDEINVTFEVPIVGWDEDDVLAIPAESGQQLLLSNACIPNIKTDGIEYFTCKEVDGKKVYGKSWLVETDLTSTNASWKTIDINLVVTNGKFLQGNDIFIQQAQSGSNYSNILYTPSTGNIGVYIGGSYKLGAGQIVTIEYTK